MRPRLGRMQALSRRMTSLRTLAIALAFTAISGCGGGVNVINTARLPVDRPDVTIEGVAKGGVSLPGTDAFNVTSFESAQDGDGRGESKATGKDGASCRAESGVTGIGKASFMIGYTFDNQSGKPLDVVVKLRLKHEATIELSPGETPIGKQPPGASNTLAFVVRDSAGVVIKSEVLTTSTSEVGPKSSSGSQDLAFDVRCPENRGYYFVIAGACEARNGTGRSATVNMTVSDISLELDWRPGSPTTTAPTAGAAP
jgi:hypothetical protein